MTDEEIIKSVSEIDGWIWQEGPPTGWKNPATGVLHILLPDYLGSRDAIIPVIEDQFDQWSYRSKFQPFLSDITFVKTQVEHAKVYFCATPRQLCEALLRATGRWKE